MTTEKNITFRKILHCDINNFYASVEILSHPELKDKPVAVGGSQEERHGIILAKSNEAKKQGVKTGQVFWQAKACCPDLIILPPHYEEYEKYSLLFRDILSEYTDFVEPFGSDEAWCDVSLICGKPGAAKELADELRERTKRELGLTISVGVSFNKIFAKLGSDIKKPDGTTVISPSNFKRAAWNLPAADLLGVGRSAEKLLTAHGILTIGDIANADVKSLERLFGKWGLYLFSYANGNDSSEVKRSDFEREVKSIGNSTTCHRDLENDRDAFIVLSKLSESIAERMRAINVMAKTVQLSLRTTDLRWFERQMILEKPSMIAAELTAAGMTLLRKHFDWRQPLRSIGIRGTNLIPYHESVQMSFFEEENRRYKSERLEYAIDIIRRRFGHKALCRPVGNI